jgi:hypothetical protein
MPGITGHAAAAKIAQHRKEEEEMTNYEPDDLNGWEFKIVRSGSGKFRNLQEIQKLCQDEDKAGWEMLEKFDDYRIRFKRKTDMRGSDSHQQIDPYRTYVGMNPNLVGPAIALSMAILIAGIVVAANYAKKDSQPFVLIVPLVIVIIVALMAVIRLRKK